MDSAKPCRLPLIFASIAFIFLVGALIVQQTVRQNREEVIIIQNSNLKVQNDNSKFKISNPTSNIQFLSPTSNLQPLTSNGEAVLGEYGEETGQISVNDATLEELDAIPGIGPKTAEKIMAGRPWTALDDALILINKRYREEARGKLKL